MIGRGISRAGVKVQILRTRGHISSGVPAGSNTDAHSRCIELKPVINFSVCLSAVVRYLKDSILNAGIGKRIEPCRHQSGVDKRISEDVGKLAGSPGCRSCVGLFCDCHGSEPLQEVYRRNHYLYSYRGVDSVDGKNVDRGGKCCTR